MIEWLKIKEFDKYSVSAKGTIKNDVTGQVLVPWVTDNGYAVVNPSMDGISKID